MRKDDAISIPLGQIDSMHIDGQNLVIKKRRLEPTQEMRRIHTNRWWNAYASMAFMAKVEIWINEQAAEMDAASGGRSEWASHASAEFTAEDVLVGILRKSKGVLRDEDLIERATTDLRDIERQKHQPEGTYAQFGLKFIDLLGEARRLSPSRVLRLQTRYQKQEAA